MEITVSVDNVDLTSVIHGRYDEEETLGHAVAALLVQRIVKTEDYRGIAGRVKEIRDEEIRAQLLPVLTEAIETPIQATNTYGEPTGKPTTLRELIAAEARALINKPADNYNRDRGTVLQNAIKTAVDAAFKAEIAAAVKEARAAVMEQYGKTVGEMAVDAMREAMRARP